MLKVFWGEERYNIDANVRICLRGIDDVHRIDAPKGLELKTIVAAAQNPTLFSERNGVLVRCGKLSADDQKAIQKLAYEFEDDESVVIVITAEAVSKRVENDDIYQECPKFSESCRNKLIDFVTAMATKEGVECTPSAAEEIVIRSGYFDEPEVTLYTLKLLAQQVALFGEVTVANVRAVIPETPAEKAYLLAGMLARGEGERLARSANRLLESKQFSEINLLGLIAKPFRLAWIERTLGKGKSGAKDYQFRSVCCIDESRMERICDVLELANQQIKAGTKARIAFNLALAQATLIAKCEA